MREENEELRLTVVAKQLDIDNLKKQIADQSSTPLMFAKDQTRMDFWKLLTRIQSEQQQLHLEKETEMTKKIQQEARNEALEKLNEKLKAKVEDLED